MGLEQRVMHDGIRVPDATTSEYIAQQVYTGVRAAGYALRSYAQTIHDLGDAISSGARPLSTIVLAATLKGGLDAESQREFAAWHNIAETTPTKINIAYGFAKDSLQLAGLAYAVRLGLASDNDSINTLSAVGGPLAALYLVVGIGLNAVRIPIMQKTNSPVPALWGTNAALAALAFTFRSLKEHDYDHERFFISASQKIRQQSEELLKLVDSSKPAA